MTVKGISIYPIKSLDGTMIEAATTYQGGIIGDRAFRILRLSDGKQVNAKIEPKLIQVRSSYIGPVVNLDRNGIRVEMGVEMEIPGERPYFGELKEESVMDSRLSRFLGYEVAVRGSWLERYPDDPTNPGPSVVALETLLSVAKRFSLDADETTRRFRPNLILEGGGVFSEEQLVGKQFRINGVDFKGTHVCRRCGVPTRDSKSGSVTPNFVGEFIQWRKSSGALPVESEGGLYRLCVRSLILPQHGPDSIVGLSWSGAELEIF